MLERATPAGPAAEGETRSGFDYDAEFDPAPPAEATTLRVRREATDEDFTVSLVD